MKQVTISVDETLLARAERLAAERGVSIEEMLRDLLEREARGETADAHQARMEMVEMARKATGGLGGWKWNREELYAERLSRYERPDLRGNGDD